MKVSVNFINQTTFLDVESSTTVSELKKKIHEKFRVLTSMQSIVYEGTELRGDASTLSDYEMKENACIILNLKKHVASSFDRKVLPAADRPLSLLKPEQSDENPTKKGHAGQLKSTRVRFDDSTSLSNTSLDDQQKVSNGNGALIDHSGEVNGIRSSAFVVVNSLGTASAATPQKFITHNFEASPIIVNDVVVNEAYLTEDSNKKKTAVTISCSVRVDTVQEIKVIF
jgi:Ubiquitin family